jgi:hypothetical protein
LRRQVCQLTLRPLTKYPRRPYFSGLLSRG